MSGKCKPNAVCSTPDCTNAVYKKPSENKKYCSNDCRATNFVVKVVVICPQCEQEFKRTNSRQVHCSRTCSNVARAGISYKIGAPNCRVTQLKKFRRDLIELYGENCSECGLDPIWNGKPLTLQVDHINGDNTDNRPENLRFLCPNCHTQTPTYAGRNIGKRLLNSAEE